MPSYTSVDVMAACSYAIDEILYSFLDPTKLETLNRTVVIPEASKHNREVASQAIDNLLLDFTSDSAAAKGPVALSPPSPVRASNDENTPSAANIPTSPSPPTQPRSPPHLSKHAPTRRKFRAVPMPPEDSSATDTGPRSRFLRDREAKKKSEAIAAKKAKLRVRRLKKEKRAREAERRAKVEAEQEAALKLLEEENARRRQAVMAERAANERRDAERRAREERMEERGRKREERARAVAKRRRSRDSAAGSEASRSTSRTRASARGAKRPLYERMAAKANEREERREAAKRRRALEERKRKVAAVDRDHERRVDERLRERRDRDDKRRPNRGASRRPPASRSPDRRADGDLRRERHRAEGARRVMERTQGGKLTRAQRMILKEREERASAVAEAERRKKEARQRKMEYAERVRAAHAGANPRPRRSIETASDYGAKRSPRISDDGAVSLPAIPPQHRGEQSPRVRKGSRGLTEDRIRANRQREARVRAKNQQRAARRGRDDRGQGRGGRIKKHAGYEVTREALEIYDKEERRMAQMRERQALIDQRRRQLEERTGTFRREPAVEEDGWLEDVMDVDEGEAERFASMYAGGSLASRFKALRG